MFATERSVAEHITAILSLRFTLLQGVTTRIFSCCHSSHLTICSAVLSVSCAFVGIVASVLAGTPVGSTIVAVDMAAFGLCCLAGKLLGRAS